LCLSSPLPDYSFWVHNPVCRYDRHLHAHAMASVSRIGSVSQREPLLFCYGSNSTPHGIDLTKLRLGQKVFKTVFYLNETD
jgi:hypothetical protein